MEVLPNISVYRNENDTTLRVSYRILSWGEKQDGSRMIAALRKHAHTRISVRAY